MPVLGPGSLPSGREKDEESAREEKVGCASSSSRPVRAILSSRDNHCLPPSYPQGGKGAKKPQERERQVAARPRRFPLCFRLARLVQSGLVVGEDRVIIGFVIFIRVVAMDPRRTAKGEIISENSGGCHAI